MKKLVRLTLPLTLAFGVFFLFGCFGDGTVKVSGVTIDGPDTVGIGESVNFTAKISPSGATHNGVTWAIAGANNIGATMTLHGGVFLAQQEGTVAITATAGDITSEPKTITVKYIPVTSIRFTCANSFKVTEDLTLAAATVPANATNKALMYAIVPDGTSAEGAAINGGVLSATGLGVIKVKALAEIDGVESNAYTVTVEKEPVTGIKNTNEKTATFQSEKVIELFNSSDLSTTGWSGGSYKSGTGHTGTNYVRLYSSTPILYKSIPAFDTDDSMEIELYARLWNTAFSNATIAVKYSADNGVSWVTVGDVIQISGNLLSTPWNKHTRTIPYGTVLKKQNILISVCYVDNTTTSEVDDITYTITKRTASFAAGSSIQLTSEVTPSNATNKDVTYEIVADGTTAAGANINGNILAATGAGMIKVRPKADGVFGDAFFIKVT